MKEVAVRSIPAFLAIFGGLLHLKDEAVPTAKREVISAGCKAFGVDSGIFDKILAIREGKFKPGKSALREIFKHYLGTVRTLAGLVDRMEK